jgi:cytochrome c
MARSAALFAMAGTALAYISSQAVAAGNPMAGKVVFARCAACHSITPGENRLGPNLAGVVGRKAGTLPGYSYSAAMKGSGVIWTPAQLDAYLANPREKLPGVKMIFAGLPKAEDRANIIAYLTKPQ